MKNRALAIIIAAAAVLMTACGQVDDEVGSSTAQAPAAAVEENEASNGADQEKADEPEEEEQSSQEEITGEIVETDSSEEEAEAESQAETSAEEETAAYEGSFESVQGETYTAEDLMDMGLGNILTDGTGYVLVPDSGGAGHAYYKLFYTSDGSEWQEGQTYDEINGNNYHISLSDGSILLISSGGPASADMPAAYELTFNGGEIKSTSLDAFFDQVKGDIPQSDSGILAEVTDVNATEDGLSIAISFSSGEGELLLDGVYTLDMEKMQLA